MTRKPHLYKVVKDALKRRIDAGDLPVGALVPREEELAAEFGVSRLTAHRALRELAAEGLVERRRRAGTRVAPRGSGGVLIRIPRIMDEISARGFTYRYELLSRSSGQAPDTVVSRLNLEPGASMLNIRCRHWADDRVFQYEDRWINLAVAPAAADRNFENVSANVWLLDNVPYSRVDHRISAQSANPAQSEALSVPTGTPLLQLERVTWWTEQGVTAANMLHPGDLYSLKSDNA